MIAIIGVGIALAVFNWRVMVRMENRLDSRIDRLDGRIDRLDERMDRLERVDRLGERVDLRGWTGWVRRPIGRKDWTNGSTGWTKGSTNWMAGSTDWISGSMPWGRRCTTSLESFPSCEGRYEAAGHDTTLDSRAVIAGSLPLGNLQHQLVDIAFRQVVAIRHELGHVVGLVSRLKERVISVRSNSLVNPGSGRPVRRRRRRTPPRCRSSSPAS